MSHLADSTFIKAFGSDKPATDIDVHADAIRYACLPITWTVERFIETLNKGTRELMGASVFYNSQSEADLANMAEGARPESFTDLKVTFRKS